MICGKSYSFRIRLPEEYAFAKTFESVFDEDTFFNSCLLATIVFVPLHAPLILSFFRLFFAAKFVARKSALNSFNLSLSLSVVSLTLSELAL